MEELRVLTFIDLNNLEGQARAMGRRADHVKLARFLAQSAEGRRCVDTYAYGTTPPDNGDRVHKWHDFLRHNGLVVVSKRAKRMPDGSIKADIDSLLVLDAMELAQTIEPDVIVLVTGDGDFAPLALRLRRYGIRVEVAATTQALASELHAACNGVIDLDQFLSQCEPRDGQAEAVGHDGILQGF